MKVLIKKLVREFLKKLNLKLSYYDRSRPRYIKAVESLGINLVFDIGANQGQFALSLLEHDYSGRIVSFEPTNNVYKKLQYNAKKFQSGILILYQL